MRHRLVRIPLMLFALLALVAAAGGTAVAKNGHGNDNNGHNHGPKTKPLKAKRLIKVSTGSLTLTFSDATVSALTAAGITATPVAPATVDATTPAMDFIFPVTKARVVTTKKAFKGFVKTSGGLTLTKAAVAPATPVSATFTNLRILVSPHGGPFITAKVNGDGRVRILQASNVVTAVVAGKPTATADVALTRKGAALMNATFGTTLTAGTAVGTAKVVLG